jgi:hypothetical protein
VGADKHLLEYLRSVRTNRVLSWLGGTALSVGPYGPIGRHPGFTSISLNIAGRCPIAGMTQPISAQASGHPDPTHLEVVMRMLLKAVFDTDAANEVIGSGQGAEVNRQITDRFQPEAFYAFAEDGQRTVLMVFDLTDPSQIPVLTEPIYQQGKAKVTLTPCMNLEDLEKGFEELASQMASTEG